MGAGMQIPRLFSVAALFIFPTQYLSTQSYCDPSVKSDTDRAEGYQQRGERCEGLYWRPHAMEANLSVVGFRRSSSINGLNLPPSFHLAWRKTPLISADAQVTVKSVSLRHDMYYRMDTRKPYSSGSFDWPTDVLGLLGLDFRNLGVFASAPVKIGRTRWQAYLPLEIGFSQTPAAAFELTLVPGMALADLSWQYSKFGSDGLPAKVLKHEKLKQSFPADKPIHLLIPAPMNPCFLFVEIDADALSPDITKTLRADFVVFVNH